MYSAERLALIKSNSQKNSLNTDPNDIQIISVTPKPGENAKKKEADTVVFYSLANSSAINAINQLISALFKLPSLKKIQLPKTEDILKTFAETFQKEHWKKDSKFITEKDQNKYIEQLAKNNSLLETIALDLQGGGSLFNAFLFVDRETEAGFLLDMISKLISIKKLAAQNPQENQFYNIQNLLNLTIANLNRFTKNEIFQPTFQNRTTKIFNSQITKIQKDADKETISSQLLATQIIYYRNYNNTLFIINAIKNGLISLLGIPTTVKNGGGFGFFQPSNVDEQTQQQTNPLAKLQQCFNEKSIENFQENKAEFEQIINDNIVLQWIKEKLSNNENWAYVKTIINVLTANQKKTNNLFIHLIDEILNLTKNSSGQNLYSKFHDLIARFIEKNMSAENLAAIQFLMEINEYCKKQAVYTLPNVTYFCGEQTTLEWVKNLNQTLLKKHFVGSSEHLQKSLAIIQQDCENLIKIKQEEANKNINERKIIPNKNYFYLLCNLIDMYIHYHVNINFKNALIDFINQFKENVIGTAKALKEKNDTSGNDAKEKESKSEQAETDISLSVEIPDITTLRANPFFDVQKFFQSMLAMPQDELKETIVKKTDYKQFSNYTSFDDRLLQPSKNNVTKPKKKLTSESSDDEYPANQSVDTSLYLPMATKSDTTNILSSSPTEKKTLPLSPPVSPIKQSGMNNHLDEELDASFETEDFKNNGDSKSDTSIESASNLSSPRSSTYSNNEADSSNINLISEKKQMLYKDSSSEVVLYNINALFDFLNTQTTLSEDEKALKIKLLAKISALKILESMSKSIRNYNKKFSFSDYQMIFEISKKDYEEIKNGDFIQNLQKFPYVITTRVIDEKLKTQQHQSYKEIIGRLNIELTLINFESESDKSVNLLISQAGKLANSVQIKPEEYESLFLFETNNKNLKTYLSFFKIIMETDKESRERKLYDLRLMFNYPNFIEKLGAIKTISKETSLKEDILSGNIFKKSPYESLFDALANKKEELSDKEEKQEAQLLEEFLNKVKNYTSEQINKLDKLELSNVSGEKNPDTQSKQDEKDKKGGNESNNVELAKDLAVDNFDAKSEQNEEDEEDQKIITNSVEREWMISLATTPRLRLLMNSDDYYIQKIEKNRSLFFMKNKTDPVCFAMKYSQYKQRYEDLSLQITNTRQAIKEIEDDLPKATENLQTSKQNHRPVDSDGAHSKNTANLAISASKVIYLTTKKTQLENYLKTLNAQLAKLVEQITKEITSVENEITSIENKIKQALDKIDQLILKKKDNLIDYVVRLSGCLNQITQLHSNNSDKAEAESSTSFGYQQQNH